MQTITVAPQDIDQSEYQAPVFAWLEEERRHRKLRLAAAFHKADRTTAMFVQNLGRYLRGEALQNEVE